MKADLIRYIRVIRVQLWFLAVALIAATFCRWSSRVRLLFLLLWLRTLCWRRRSRLRLRTRLLRLRPHRTRFSANLWLRLRSRNFHASWLWLSTWLRLRSHRTRFSTNLRLRSWNFHSSRWWLWSCRRCDALTTRLLLRSHDRTFSSNCTSRTLDALLLPLHISDTTLRWLNNTSSRLFHRLLLSCLWCFAALTLVSHLELLSPGAIRRRIHTHSLRQVRPERGRRRCAARNHCRVAYLARDSQRDVDLAATPRRMHHRISQQRHQQRIQHRPDRHQRVSIGPLRPSPIKIASCEIIDAHHGHCIRHVEIHAALIQISTSQVVRLPVRVVVMRHVGIAWSQRHPTNLVLSKRNERDEGRRIDRSHIRSEERRVG